MNRNRRVIFAERTTNSTMRHGLCGESRDKGDTTCNMFDWRSSLALALPWIAAPAGAQVASRRGTATEMRFREMDRNNDGVITRDEWSGTAQSFRVHDWNGDGVLSGDEVRVGAVQNDRGLGAEDFNPPTARQFNAWNATAFTDLDHNRDGRIAANEWHYDVESFRRADRNRDGSLSRVEFLGADVEDDRNDTFDNLDANGNGRVERQEWHASADAFDWLDRNRDGFLTRAEVLGTAQRGAGAGRAGGDEFTSLDVNRDGKIMPNEWHWSRSSFDQRDANRDGMLTRRELSSTEAAAVATSGQLVRVNPAQRWTDTGVDVRAGDPITLNAEGTAQLSLNPDDVAGPGGSRTRRPPPQRTTTPRPPARPLCHPGPHPGGRPRLNPPGSPRPPQPLPRGERRSAVRQHRGFWVPVPGQGWGFWGRPPTPRPRRARGIPFLLSSPPQAPGFSSAPPVWV